MELTDSFDSGEILSVLDRARILSLDIGDKMDNEIGVFSVCRYKNEYIVTFNLPNMSNMLSFKTPEQIFHYIEEMS